MNIHELKEKLTRSANEQVIPIMKRYGLNGTSLQARLLWKPTVLILGNYSSGKSTLINEIIGADIQQTGQAPTDDSFTVLTAPEDHNWVDGAEPEVVENRSGSVVLNDSTLPFHKLKRHGRAFAAHFRLKRVSAPVLRDLVLIDSPGMLDSVTERDRGYNYSDVVGELAHLVDMVLYFFDPHKAGTIRESFTFLREILPGSISEDRVLFVINRVDECANLNDLLRVYGTLCWNLSQMTGRKDIPPIYVTWSPSANQGLLSRAHLEYLQNQREEVKRAILHSPKNHIDHLVEDFERSAKSVIVGLDVLNQLATGQRTLFWKLTSFGWMFAVILTGAALLIAHFSLQVLPLDPLQLGLAATGTILVLFTLWVFAVIRPLLSRRRVRDARSVSNHEVNGTPEMREVWLACRPAVAKYAQDHPDLPGSRIRRDSKITRAVLGKILKSARDEDLSAA
jgi:EH domain-containing protein 1